MIEEEAYYADATSLLWLAFTDANTVNKQEFLIFGKGEL